MNLKRIGQRLAWCLLVVSLCSITACTAKPESTFRFTATSAHAPNGASTIEARVYPVPGDRTRRRVSFAPALMYTQIDVEVAAAYAFRALFGKEPFESQPGALRIARDPSSGNEFWYWNLPQSQRRYCVMPVRGKSNDVTELIVWLQER